MIVIQEQKLNRFIALRDYLAVNPILLEQNNHVIKWYELFLNHLNALINIKTAMEEDFKIELSFAGLRDDLVHSALIISRKITTYSLLEEMTYTHGVYCYTFEELSDGSDVTLLTKCSDLLKFIEVYRRDLTDYGIDLLVEGNFRNLKDHFQSAMETKILNEESIVARTYQVAHLLTEMDEVVETKLQFANGLFVTDLT
jgi:hypothetical protein